MGPSPWHKYPTPPAPPSQPPVITQFTAMPLFTSIICEHTAEDNVGLRTSSCEVLTSNYELVERKLDLAVPTAAFVSDNLTAGQDYNAKLYVVDTSENVTTREEYVFIVDFTPLRRSTCSPQPRTRNIQSPLTSISPITQAVVFTPDAPYTGCLILTQNYDGSRLIL